MLTKTPVPDVLLNGTALLLAALPRKFLLHEETPDYFVGVWIGTGLPYGLLDLILFSARPRVSRALHAVKHNLRVVVAAVVRIDSDFHLALFVRRQLTFLRLFFAAIDLGPGLRTVFRGND